MTCLLVDSESTATGDELVRFACLRKETMTPDYTDINGFKLKKCFIAADVLLLSRGL